LGHEQRSGERLAPGLARAPFVPLLADLDEDDDLSPDDGDLDDSHYELPVADDDGQHDSQDALPAALPGRPASDDDFPAYVAVHKQADAALVNPWYVNFIDSWARYHFAVALCFGALSIAVLGFCLVRAGGGVQIVSLPITALITGGITLVAFSFLLITATALNLLVVDLARGVRRLGIPQDRERRVASE
jgi:hypothetical protein